MADNGKDEIFIFDGGTGREIERCGGPFKQPEWSALALYERPEVVREVHERFLRAGARAITTNTYAIVPFHIGVDRYNADAKRLLRLAVDLAHQAVMNYCTEQNQEEERPAQDDNERNNDTKTKPQILGSIPPVCGSYEPDSFHEGVAGPILQDFLDVLGNDSNIDVLLLETLGSIREAAFSLQCIQQFFYSKARRQTRTPTLSLPIWISFCVKAEYGIDDQKPRLLSGETIADAIRTLSKEGLLSSVDVILVNCCDIRLVKDSLDEINAALRALDDQAQKKRKFGAYPNAFSVPPPDSVNRANRTLRQVDLDITPTLMSEYAREWTNSGACVLGGCCGVGPEHIHALRMYCSASHDVEKSFPASTSTVSTSS